MALPKLPCKDAGVGGSIKVVASGSSTCRESFVGEQSSSPKCGELENWRTGVIRIWSLESGELENWSTGVLEKY
jgi:hypothetical protein